jgi:predicted nucleic acid-binding protein
LSFYLDASFMVPLQIQEAMTEVADRFALSAAAPLLVSDFGAGEVSAAITRLVRMGQLTEEKARIVFLAFDEWRQNVTERADIEHTDLQQAELLVRRVDSGLRMPDALHIAMARRRGAVLVTFDQGMARAAKQFGADVLVPA